MNNYFNTTNLIGEDLKKSKLKADSQDTKILDFFQNNHLKSFTPFDVLNIVFTPQTPITSIRRSITSLTNKGYLVKTEEKRDGKFGKVNFTWKLYVPERYKQLEMF